MAKLGKILGTVGKFAGNVAKAAGGKLIEGIKSLTKSKPKQVDTKVSKVPTEVKNEVKNIVNDKPEPDKLAEQDNRAAESEVKASKVAKSKANKDKSSIDSISNRTKAILQNYGLKGEIVKTVKNQNKSTQVNNSSTSVYNKSDIFNIYQQKDHSVSIDKAVMMLAANNDILANVNETLKLIHNQGSIDIDYKKIKSETAKVLSEKAKDEANSVNKTGSKSSQKLAELKAQEAMLVKALSEAKDPYQAEYLRKMTEILAKIELNQNTLEGSKSDSDSSGLATGLMSLLPLVGSLLPTGLLSKAGGLVKGAWNGVKNFGGKAWDKVASFFGKGSEKVASEAAGKVASKTATEVATKTARSGTKEFFKKLSPKALKLVTKKLIARSIIKNAIKGGAKLGAKKIPIAGAVVGLGLGIERCMGDKPDYAGAALDIGSGIASIFPGVGTAISAGLDVAGITRDVMNCVDDLKEGNATDLFTDEELAEILVEPTDEELKISEAQEAEADKISSRENWLLFSPLQGLVLARKGYRYLRENGIIGEGHDTLDKLSGYESIQKAGNTAAIASAVGTPAAPLPSNRSNPVTTTSATHHEAKSSNKSFKGVSVVDSSSDQPDLDLSDLAPDFQLSSEDKELMEYWKNHQANPTDPEAANKLVDYWKSYEGKLQYSQTVRDINKGSTDCSGMVMNSMKNLFGIDVTDGGKGYCAASFATNRIGSVVAHSDIDQSGNGSGKITDDIKEKLQPGDVIYTTLPKWKGKRPYSIGHASLYIGDGKCLSQGGRGLGPYEVKLSAYDGKFVLAKRYLGTGNSEITKAELTESKNASAPKVHSKSSSGSSESKSTPRAPSTNKPIKVESSSSKPVTPVNIKAPESTESSNSSINTSTPTNTSNVDSHNVIDNSQVTNIYNNTYNINNSQDNGSDISIVR